ncbi:unnamed protein product [Phyllotreta striolata]|uniref:Uncharacterized protein n=1 Tax=Phyllotreta striolata TaxID=444603 RepID=A0A9N9XK07_PHYSR|nr:unnamed protein product [Phyllotreta striolata]
MTIAANTSNTNNVCTGIEYTKTFVKQMVKNTLFTGVFQEKRLVEELGSYRDVVTICPEEEDFIKNIKSIKTKIEREVITKAWVGITEPSTIVENFLVFLGAPVGYNLWVVLPKEVFGKYWYRVKTVEFLDREIRLRLDIVRPYQRETTPLRDASENMDFSAIIEEKKTQFKRNIHYFLSEMLTLRNFMETVKFFAILIAALLAGVFNVLNYLLEWFLKFIRELSNLTRAFTPIVINVINLVGSTIFGLFKLIYALFTDNRKPAPVCNNYIIDPSYSKYINKPLPYNNFPAIQQRGPRITPLD